MSARKFMANKVEKISAKKATEDSPKATKRVQKRSENFKTGHWELKYLQFINSFISQSGNTIESAAKKAGITRQTINHWFNLDDAKISSIINFVEKLGYNITFSLRPSTSEVGDALVSINRKDVPPTEGSKKLSFLDEAFNLYGISRKDTAAMLGLGYTALYYWFKNDDVFISYIYKMAEKNNLKLVIKIDQKEEV